MIGRELGNYVVRSLLGEGGMGAVFACEHRFLGTRAAIKVLHGSYAGNPAVAQRFFQEAKSSLQIGHPNIIRTLDFGQSPAGELYLVMELLEGRSLARTLAEDGPYGEGACARIGADIAEGLAAAHAQGIVHRDLKPDNVIITNDGVVKILDFGIAKVASSSGGTKTGSLLGTPQYMAPEQAKGSKHVGPHTDVYALGAILFEMLTARPPFQGEDVTELLTKHLFEAPPAPSSLVALSTEMETLVLSCLSKKPEERPASMQEVRDRLRARIGATTQSGARPIAPTMLAASTAVRTGATTTLGNSAAEAIDAPAPRRRTGLLVGVGAAVLAVGVIAIAVRGSHRGPAEATPASAPPVAAAPPPAATTPAPAPAAPAAPEKIALQIDSVPPGAEVYRAADGVLLGSTPLTASMTPTDGKAVFLVKHAGYQEARVELPADRDSESRTELVRVASRPSRPAARPPAATKPSPAPSKRVRDGALDPFAN